MKQDANKNTTNRDWKKFVAPALVSVGVLVALIVILISTNTVATSELQSVEYTNSKNTHFKLDFYTKHESKKLGTGNTQLISKVSKDGKYPLALSINSGATSDYSEIKDCTKYKTAFIVKNDYLKQNLVVCDMLAGRQVKGRSAANAVYITGFIYKNQTHIVTIAQDYPATSPSTQADAQKSLARYGLQPYQADIKRILASIQVQ